MAYDKPVKVGDEIEITIENLGSKGDGVARVGNSKFVIMVPQTEIDKTYKIKITRVFPKQAFAEVIEEI